MKLEVRSRTDWFLVQLLIAVRMVPFLSEVAYMLSTDEESMLDGEQSGAENALQRVESRPEPAGGLPQCVALRGGIFPPLSHLRGVPSRWTKASGAGSPRRSSRTGTACTDRGEDLTRSSTRRRRR